MNRLKTDGSNEHPINLDPELDDIQVTYPYECTACGIRFQQITEAEEHFSSQHQNVEESEKDLSSNEILLEKSSDVHEREMQDISDLLSLTETAPKFAAGFINEDPVLNETITLTYENQSVMLSSGHKWVSSVFKYYQECTLCTSGILEFNGLPMMSMVGQKNLQRI